MKNTGEKAAKATPINKEVDNMIHFVFVNDDTRDADKLSFAVNAKPHGLSEAEKETVTAAAEGLVSVFEEDMPGRFAGVFVYEAVSEKDVDCFVFQGDDIWFLLISSLAVKSPFLKCFIAESFSLALEYGPETQIDLVKLGSKK